MLEKICGMNVKNTYKGPAALLAEVEDDQGNQNIALVFQEEYHNHPLLNDSLSGIMSFLHNPVIPGIADLIKHEKGTGAFVFNTGPCVSIAQLIRRMGDAGLTPGPRAGLEFMERAGRILTDTSEYTINAFAVGSHGSLNPWRILARRNGSIQIIGYAIPQVEMREFHRDARNIPREDSFRYCPPERISNQPEDLTSDIFVLALIAFEIMITRPVYDGSIDDIRQKAVRGEAARQLFNYQNMLPKYVRDFLTKALKVDRKHRFSSSQAFFSELESILRRPDLPGMSFNATLAKMEEMPQQVLGADLVSVETSTSIFGKDKLLEQYGLSKDDSAIKQDVVVPQKNSSVLDAIVSKETLPQKTTKSSSFWTPVARTQSEAPPPKEDLEASMSQKIKPTWGAVDRSSSKISPLGSSGSRSDAPPITKKKEQMDPSELLNLLTQSNRKKTVPIVPPKKDAAQTFDVPKISNVSSENPPPPPEFRVPPPNTDLKASPLSRNKPPDLPPIKTARPPVIPPIKQTIPTTAPPQEQLIKTTIPVSPPKQQTAAIPSFEASNSVSQKIEKIQEPKPYTGGKDVEQNPFLGPVLQFSPFFEKGEAENYTLDVGTHKIRFRAQKDSSTANVLGTTLIGRRLPLRMDPMGKMSAWYRFAKTDGFYSGQTLMSDMQEAELSLVVVPNELRWVEISVPEQGTTVMTSIGSAIPMLSILDHLVCWLQLEQGDWSILVNNMVTDYYDILDDFPIEKTYTLVLQRK